MHHSKKPFWKIGAQFALNAPKSRKAFLTLLLVLLGEEAKVEAGLVYLEIVLILMQDRCTVCTGHTIFSEINLDAPDGTHR